MSGSHSARGSSLLSDVHPLVFFHPVERAQCVLCPPLLPALPNQFFRLFLRSLFTPPLLILNPPCLPPVFWTSMPGAFPLFSVFVGVVWSAARPVIPGKVTVDAPTAAQETGNPGAFFICCGSTRNALDLFVFLPFSPVS